MPLGSINGPSLGGHTFYIVLYWENMKNVKISLFNINYMLRVLMKVLSDPSSKLFGEHEKISLFNINFMLRVLLKVLSDPSSKLFGRAG